MSLRLSAAPDEAPFVGRFQGVGGVAGDIEKADAAGEKGLDGDLVGGAEDGRGRAAADERVAGNG